MCGIELIDREAVLRPFRAGEGGRHNNIPLCDMLLYDALSGLISARLFHPFRAWGERGFYIIPRCGMFIYIALSGLFRPASSILQILLPALKGRHSYAMVEGHRNMKRTQIALKGRYIATMVSDLRPLTALKGRSILTMVIGHRFPMVAGRRGTLQMVADRRITHTMGVALRY